MNWDEKKRVSDAQVDGFKYGVWLSHGLWLFLFSVYLLGEGKISLWHMVIGVLIAALMIVVAMFGMEKASPW